MKYFVCLFSKFQHRVHIISTMNRNSVYAQTNIHAHIRNYYVWKTHAYSVPSVGIEKQRGVRVKKSSDSKNITNVPLRIINRNSSSVWKSTYDSIVVIMWNQSAFFFHFNGKQFAIFSSSFILLIWQREFQQTNPKKKVLSQRANGNMTWK